MAELLKHFLMQHQGLKAAFPTNVDNHRLFSQL